jgi:hypothetical protein
MLEVGNKDMLPKVNLAINKSVIFAATCRTSISHCDVMNRVDMAAKVLRSSYTSRTTPTGLGVSNLVIPQTRTSRLSPIWLEHKTIAIRHRWIMILF